MYPSDGCILPKALTSSLCKPYRLESGAMGRASVPSGASTGSREAIELRDGFLRELDKEKNGI